MGNDAVRGKTLSELDGFINVRDRVERTSREVAKSASSCQSIIQSSIPSRVLGGASTTFYRLLESVPSTLSDVPGKLIRSWSGVYWLYIEAYNGGLDKYTCSTKI